MDVSISLAYARRPRDFVRVAGPDAAAFLQRLVSNDVEALEPGASCEALLLTAKARVIAPLVVLREAADDFLVLTEPGLGEEVRAQLQRVRLRSRVELEREQHESLVVLGATGALPSREFGVPAHELIDAAPPAGARPLDEDELEALRIEAGTPRFGREIDERVLPAEAGLTRTHVSFTKGCYPGQEPVARLHYRGHPNRELRVLEIEAPEPPPYDAELEREGKVVGRLTSAARRRDGTIVGLGYVRREVPPDAELALPGGRARPLH